MSFLIVSLEHTAIGTSDPLFWRYNSFDFVSPYRFGGKVARILFLDLGTYRYRYRVYILSSIFGLTPRLVLQLIDYEVLPLKLFAP